MEHWKEIAAVVTSILSAAGAWIAKIASGAAKAHEANATMYKDLWESEKEDRMRLEDKLDGFYAEGRRLAGERDSENTALRREVEELRILLASRGRPLHAPKEQDPEHVRDAGPTP